MGCNCNNNGIPLSLKKRIRRETKKKIAEVKKIWRESSSNGKIISDKDELGFKKTE